MLGKMEISECNSCLFSFTAEFTNVLCHIEQTKTMSDPSAYMQTTVLLPNVWLCDAAAPDTVGYINTLLVDTVGYINTLLVETL